VPPDGRWRQRDQKHRDDGKYAEDGGNEKDATEAELPSDKSRHARADHITGVIRDLVPPELPVEATCPGHAQRDAGDGRAQQRAGYRRGDLRQGHHRVRVGVPDDAGGEYGADARGYDGQTFVAGRIDDGARGCGDEQPRHATDRHHGADRAGAPPDGLQENTQKRPYPRLDVGHEEVQRFERPVSANGAIPGLAGGRVGHRGSAREDG
jgi:hypothetical protein